ncbi:MAG TPA: hypothetical protein H9909_13055 [Candidatus Mediterraneibacter norfolkensis]|nr:hypothetical protein [Candidatus Mediterraneibacter norfolkensis]
MMRRKRKFYAVAGFNGYGVYNDYDKVLDSKKYINGFKVKSFIDKGAALRYAEKTYYEMQIQRYHIFHPICLNKDYGGMNWFYFMNHDLVKPFVLG